MSLKPRRAASRFARSNPRPRIKFESLLAEPELIVASE